MSPFQAYRMYIGFKAHFEGKFDILKYHGKVAVKRETFDEHRNKELFERLSKQPDVAGMLLANFSGRMVLYVGDILDDFGRDAYSDWLRRVESLEYIFSEDIKKLAPLKQTLISTGDYPQAVRLLNTGKVSVETIIILNELFNGSIFKNWEAKINDKIVFPSQLTRMKRYAPFVEFDRDKYYSKLQRIILDNTMAA